MASLCYIPSRKKKATHLLKKCERAISTAKEPPQNAGEPAPWGRGGGGVLEPFFGVVETGKNPKKQKSVIFYVELW